MTHSRYPDFEVLAEKEAWDAFSREVVLRRLKPDAPELLNEAEIATLRAVAANLLYESRSDVLDFVISHVDAELRSPVGESERKPGVPRQHVLVLRGLQLLDVVAGTGGIPDTYELPAGSPHDATDGGETPTPFARCTPSQQAWLLQQLQLGKLNVPPAAPAVGQKDVFKKLLELTVDALASHPAVWSDMGYAGPAYPRGYYRIEVGLTDPWEAKRPGGAR